MPMKFGIGVIVSSCGQAADHGHIPVPVLSIQGDFFGEAIACMMYCYDSAI